MRYKVAYLTSKNPADRTVSSGVYFYQSEAIEKHIGEVFFLGPVNNWLIDSIKLFARLLNKFFGINYKATHNIIVSKIYGQVFTKLIRKIDADVVFAEKASVELAYLKTSIPIIYSTDATFKSLLNYYPDFSDLLKHCVYWGNNIEQKAIDKARIVICASKWAAESVIKEYNGKREKVYVLPRGANIDRPDVIKVSRKKDTDNVSLLFIGRDWKRKGFDIACNVVRYLNLKGYSAKLTAIGVKPVNDFMDNNIEYLPFLNKNIPESREKFQKLMVDSDFLLMPTRAECLGITFCEASAYGLPVLTSNTGGVSEIVINGLNGYALDYDASFEEYGDLIISLVSDIEKYNSLVDGAHTLYNEKLNWDEWGKSLHRIIVDNIKEN